MEDNCVRRLETEDQARAYSTYAASQISERFVDKLVSVFDMTICKALRLSESISTRVMFLYDRERDLKKFLVLNNGMPKDLADKVTSWLEKNIDGDNITSVLRSNELDADDLKTGFRKLP